MGLIKAARLTKEFDLPEHLARESVAEETVRVLRRGWQPWGWLAVTLPLVGWVYLSIGTTVAPGPFFLLLGAVPGWQLVGRHLAGPSILAAAQRKADRLAGKYR